MKILYLENGYFPNTLQIDPCGVNAEASICELSRAEWERDPLPAMAQSQPQTPPVDPTGQEQEATVDEIIVVGSQIRGVRELIERLLMPAESLAAA